MAAACVGHFATRFVIVDALTTAIGRTIQKTLAVEWILVNTTGPSDTVIIRIRAVPEQAYC